MHLKISALFLLISVLLFIACASSPPAPSPSISDDNQVQQFFSTVPSGDGLVFIGTAGRRLNPDETLQLALTDAAQRVAMFHQVSGEYILENTIGSGFLDWTHDVRAVLFFDVEGSVRFLDSLQYDIDKDTMLFENAFFVRTFVPMTLPSRVDFRPRNKNETGRPDWINNIPEIDGYETGVGFSSRRASMAETFNNSRNNAIFSIIKNISATAQSSGIQYHRSDSIFAYDAITENSIHAHGTLNSFYVLDTWIDRRTLQVWTLAIAEKTQ